MKGICCIPRFELCLGTWWLLLTTLVGAKHTTRFGHSKALEMTNIKRRFIKSRSLKHEETLITEITLKKRAEMTMMTQSYPWSKEGSNHSKSSGTSPHLKRFETQINGNEKDIKIKQFLSPFKPKRNNVCCRHDFSFSPWRTEIESCPWCNEEKWGSSSVHVVEQWPQQWWCF